MVGLWRSCCSRERANGRKHPSSTVGRSPGPRSHFGLGWEPPSDRRCDGKMRGTSEDDPADGVQTDVGTAPEAVEETRLSHGQQTTVSVCLSPEPDVTAMGLTANRRPAAACSYRSLYEDP